jgi:hypothetical protein
MEHSDALDIMKLTKRFRPRRNYKAPRLEDSAYAARDAEIVVLCSVQTLLAPQNIPSLNPALTGQAPCEGYFIVVEAENPSRPLLEIGFIYLPEHRRICQKKSALENLSFRVQNVHGIDPYDRRLLDRCRSMLRGDEEKRRFVTTNNLSDLLDKVWQPLLDVIHRNKQELGSTCLFLTSDDSTEIDSVKLSLQWLTAQTETKPFRSAIRTLVELFPLVNQFPGQERPDPCERGNRCAHHPATTLVPRTGKPFACCKLQAKRLLWSLCDLSESIDNMGDDSGAESEDELRTEQAKGMVSSSASCSHPTAVEKPDDVLAAAEAAVAAAVAGIALPFFFSRGLGDGGNSFYPARLGSTAALMREMVSCGLIGAPPKPPAPSTNDDDGDDDDDPLNEGGDIADLEILQEGAMLSGAEDDGALPIYEEVA